MLASGSYARRYGELALSLGTLIHPQSDTPCYTTRVRQLFTSAYDCSIRTVSLANGISTSIYALPDPDALINHFDISPSGHEIWAVDSLGGLNHVDMREDNGNGKSWARRRWVISSQRTNTKIGGIGINRAFYEFLWA